MVVSENNDKNDKKRNNSDKAWENKYRILSIYYHLGWSYKIGFIIAIIFLLLYLAISLAEYLDWL